MKNRKVGIIGVLSALALSFLMAGCAHEVYRSNSSSVSSDGTVKSKEKVVTQEPDGTVTQKEETRKVKP